jgi:hypothetical protein
MEDKVRSFGPNWLRVLLLIVGGVLAFEQG